MENVSLMKVESIAECSGAFCNTFDLHLSIIGIENHFESPLKSGFTVSDETLCNVLMDLQRMTYQKIF